MKRVFTKLACTAMAAVMTITCAPVANFTTASVFAVDAEAATTITAETGSWFETAYVEWLPVSGASSYEAYVKKSGASSYTKLDDELIRQYNTYCRADALGLAAGNYTMKVVAKNSSGSEIASIETGTIAVQAYKRDGFAFSSGSYEKGAGMGGYKADGTPKDDAVILYVTDENKNTITCDVTTNAKGAKTTGTGLGGIMKLFEKGYETRPFIIRFVGEIAPPQSTDKFKSDVTDAEYHSNGGTGDRILDVKYNMKNIKSGGGITFEGVGNDTVLHFNLSMSNAKDIEVRNLAFKDMTTSDEDAVTIVTTTDYWVHNNDFFYGGQGSDKDQAKGDGSVDIKKTPDMGTISDNHFWDTGKSSLCGLNESNDYHVTYARNWFDHSDSRHPRIRTGSVHIYNNYFDGNAKYGVGVTQGASAFVEANYFRNANDVMMSSAQGTDATGTGTFSGENGGIIKSFNNIMAGTYKFIEANNGDGTYNQDSDAYTVANRSDEVPSGLVTVKGGTSYNNFDKTMDLGVSESDILSPSEVPAYVMANAGRCDGGNFTYAFNDSTDDDDYSVNSSLVTALSNYRSSIITIGGTVSTQPDTSATATSVTGVDGNTSYATRAAGYAAEAAKLPTSTETSGNSSAGNSGGTVESDLTALTAGSYDAATITSDSTRFTVSNNKATSSNQLKIGTGYVLFKVDDNATVTISYKCGSTASGTSASVILNGQESASVAGASNAKTQDFTVTGLAAGSYKLTANAGSVSAQITKITVSYNGSVTTTETSTETTTKATETTTKVTETTTKVTETSTETTTSAPVESDSTQISFNNGYSFSGVKGTLTTDKTYGGAYYTVSGTAKNDGDNKVTLDGTNATVLDTDTGATTNLFLPITSASNGTVTISGTMTPSVATNNWTLLQLWGKKTNAESGELESAEIVGIRTVSPTDKVYDYGVRINGSSTVTDTTVVMTASKAVEYTIVVDITNKTASVTLDGTTKDYTDVDVESIDTIKFVTASGSRNVVVGDVTVSYSTPTLAVGDANCDGSVDNKDAALMLKYIAGVATLTTQGYKNAAAVAADTTTVDMLDVIAIINGDDSDDSDDSGDTTETPTITGVYNHNFTTDGVTSEFFTISGNTSTSKGTTTYGGLTLTTCLKMESKTSIKFTGEGTIILVFGSNNDESDVKIDGTTYTTDANGVLVAEVGSGEHTITKGDTMNLYYMSFAPED